MNLQNSDDCREKPAGKADAADSRRPLRDRAALRHQSKRCKADGLRYFLYAGLMTSSLNYGANAYAGGNAVSNTPMPARQEAAYVSASSQRSKLVIQSPAGSPDINSGNESNELIIKADVKGHFRGMVLINGIPMPFLIDTGATDTVVPARMAAAAKLPYGRYLLATTAGGKIAIRETSINSLKLGNAEVHNLKAQMNDHLSEVLIGMSTLRNFKISQNGDTMILIGNAQTVDANHASGSTFQNETAQTAAPKIADIKKTVSCDARKICTTKYSDR